MAEVTKDKYNRVIRALELEDYSGEELEDLGKRLVKTFLKYTSKMQLSGSNLLVFDFSVKDISMISEASINLMDGITYEEGIEYYRNHIISYLDVVGSLVVKKEKSMKENYQNAIILEIEKFIKLSNSARDYWG